MTWHSLHKYFYFDLWIFKDPMMRPTGHHLPVSWESYKKKSVSSAECDQDLVYSRINTEIRNKVQIYGMMSKICIKEFPRESASCDCWCNCESVYDWQKQTRELGLGSVLKLTSDWVTPCWQFLSPLSLTHLLSACSAPDTGASEASDSGGAGDEESPRSGDQEPGGLSPVTGAVTTSGWWAVRPLSTN